jgi:hypothetical protein
VIGPLLAAWLLAEQVPLPNIFLWASLGGAITVALALAVKESERGPLIPGKPFCWRLAGLPSRFKRYLAVLALFTLGNSSNMFLLHAWVRR